MKDPPCALLRTGRKILSLGLIGHSIYWMLEASSPVLLPSLSQSKQPWGDLKSCRSPAESSREIWLDSLPVSPAPPSPHLLAPTYKCNRSRGP